MVTTLSLFFKKNKIKKISKHQKVAMTAHWRGFLKIPVRINKQNKQTTKNNSNQKHNRMGGMGVCPVKIKFC